MQWVKSISLVFYSLMVVGCTYLRQIPDADVVADDAGEEITHTTRVTGKPRKSKTGNTVQKKAPAKVLPDVIDLAQGKVIFIRSSVVASAVGAKIYDVTNGSPVFIANVDNNTQVHHNVASGNYTYMVMSGDSVDYLNVNVLSNLSYYSIVKPSMGAWRPSFSLYPIKPRSKGDKGSNDRYFFDDEKVESLLSAVTPIVDARRQKPVRQDEGLMEKHVRHWQSWKDKTPEQLAHKTLNSLDGL